MLFGREPVAIAAAIRAVILLAIAFGLRWTPEQIAAIMLAVEAILTVVVRRHDRARVRAAIESDLRPVGKVSPHG